MCLCNKNLRTPFCENCRPKTGEFSDSAQTAGSVEIPETWLGQLLYIFRWKRRQKMIYKATIDMGRKVTELELFGNELHEPNATNEFPNKQH